MRYARRRRRARRGVGAQRCDALLRKNYADGEHDFESAKVKST